MRALVPVVRCDGCGNDLPPETRSASVTADWGDGRKDAYIAELCITCSETAYKALYDAVNKYLRPDVPSRNAGPRVKQALKHRADLESVENRTCPTCGFTSRTRGGLGTHLREHHDMTLREAGLAYTGKS